MAKTSPQQHRKSFFGQIVRGQLLSLSLFKRIWIPVFVVVLILISYIYGTFNIRRMRGDIRRLETRLSVIKTESLTAKGRYMSRIRESALQQQLDTAGLDLQIIQPPFTIK